MTKLYYILNIFYYRIVILYSMRMEMKKKNYKYIWGVSVININDR
jgi:hypothetical protein